MDTSSSKVRTIKTAWLAGLLDKRGAGTAPMRLAVHCAFLAIDGEDVRGLVTALKDIAARTTEAETKRLALDVVVDLERREAVTTA